MGDNVIDDAQVRFRFETNDGEYGAGGTTGQIILNTVEISAERPTNGKSGIGNEGEVGVSYGTRTVSLDTEEELNREAAELLEDLWMNDRTPNEVSVIAADVLDTRGSKFDWNEFSVTHEDDSSSTVSFAGKLRGVDIEANP